MAALTEKQKQSIYQKLKVADKTVVLLDVLGIRNISQHEKNKNIYCIKNNFEIIWQIDAEPTQFSEDSFTSMRIEENNIIHAKRFSGLQYKVDIYTGKAEIIRWDK